MGLDTSHGCWHGAYSAFHRWRTRIAEVAGYGDQWRADGIEIDDAEDVEDIAQPPADAILVLLMHSDCDGEIPPELCGPLADRLEGLLPNLRGDGGGHLGDYQAATQLFIDGLRIAAKEKESVEFS